MANRKVLVLTGAFVSLALVLVLGGCAFLQQGDDVVDVANFTNSSLMQSVSRVTEDGIKKAHPAISPDGTKLLYTEYRPDTGQSDIMMLRNVNSSAKTPLVTSGYATTPSWYEDSTRFLYSLNENNSNRIVRSSAAGGGRTNITRNPVAGQDLFPVIRNGVILIQTWEAGDWRIYSMTETGNEITRLGDGFDPAWHPFDMKFIYVKGNPSAIWEMDLTTMQETQLYSMPPFNIRRPQYTSDGRHIVFQRGTSQMENGTQVITTQTRRQAFVERVQTRRNTVTRVSRWQLYSITSEGANESVLTEGSVDCTWPALDSENNLYFVTNALGVKSGKTDIFKARLNFE